MALQITIAHAQEVAEGVWRAQITPSELAFLGGRILRGGQRSVVVTEGATFEEGRLMLRPDAAFAINIGVTAETLFIERYPVANSSDASVEAEPRSNRTKTIERGTRDSIVPLGRRSRCFWVTVGRGLQTNFEIALNEGVWGVKEKYRDRLKDIQPGDLIVFYGGDLGFCLCQVESTLLVDRKRLWEDDVYPYRVRISQPISRNTRARMSDVFRALTDPSGHAYDTVNAAGRAIGGAAGVFRDLNAEEVEILFGLLGWKTAQEEAARV